MTEMSELMESRAPAPRRIRRIDRNDRIKPKSCPPGPRRIRRNDRNDRINIKSCHLALAEFGEFGEMTEMTELIQSRTALALTYLCLNFNSKC